jgi:hypothetical protein
MKRKILLFVITSIAFAIALYLVFWLFDFISKNHREIGTEIKLALSIGVLSGFFTVFFTKLFDIQKRQ